MTLEQLAKAGRAPALPLRIELPGGELEVLSLLRVLPGQRYVGEARWQGRRVLAKLLVSERASRQFAREREGCRLLAAAAAPTPALLDSGAAVARHTRRVLDERGLLSARTSGGTESFLVTGDPTRAAPVVTDLLSRALGAAHVQNEGEIHRAPPRIERIQT